LCVCVCVCECVCVLLQEQEIIEKKIAKTHRQKIEEFNLYLSKMPEHHDIPRVGPG
jgi:protein FAM32A